MKTTLESANEKRHEILNDGLQALLEKNLDAEKGYKKGMTEADSPALRDFLKHQAAQRNRFATALSHELHEIGEKPKESGSTTGTLHRTWMDIKTAFTGNDDKAILEECIRGEKASVKEYDEVLSGHKVPLAVENILISQRNEIRKTLDEVSALEDLAGRNYGTY
ncbi:MAG: PA2169 family four-helix-bundle protein [Leeuwenhoekiella sp.]